MPLSGQVLLAVAGEQDAVPQRPHHPDGHDDEDRGGRPSPPPCFQPCLCRRETNHRQPEAQPDRRGDDKTCPASGHDESVEQIPHDSSETRLLRMRTSLVLEFGESMSLLVSPLGAEEIAYVCPNRHKPLLSRRFCRSCRAVPGRGGPLSRVSPQRHDPAGTAGSTLTGIPLSWAVPVMAS